MLVTSRKGPEARRFALEARTRREQFHWLSSRLDLQPADRVLVIDEMQKEERQSRLPPQPDRASHPGPALFDKAYAMHLDPSDAGLVDLLRAVRSRLKPDGRIALMAWPVEPSMYDRPFRPEDDTLVQRTGEALAAQLRAAGFRDVRLRFRPTKPLASVCVTAVNRPARPVWLPVSLFFGSW